MTKKRDGNLARQKMNADGFTTGEAVLILGLLGFAIILVVGVGYITWMASAALCVAWGVATESRIWVQLWFLLFSYGIVGASAGSCKK